MIQTTDTFYPLVADPFLYGRYCFPLLLVIGWRLNPVRFWLLNWSFKQIVKMHFFRSQDRMRLSTLSSLRSRCDQRGQRPLPPRHLDQVLLQVLLVAVMFSP